MNKRGTVAAFLILLARARGLETRCIPRANRYVKPWDDAAYVMGGIGSYGKQEQCASCLAFAESLAVIGGWGGNIYILNDYRDDTLRFGEATIRMIHVQDSLGATNFSNTHAGGKGGFLKSQIFKLPKILETVLIWHDCDKLSGVPDCIGATLGSPLDFERNDIYVGKWPDQCRRETNMKAYLNCTGRCGSGVHIGTFVAHRKASAAIMEQWFQLEIQEPATVDFVLFYDAVQILNKTGQGPRIGVLPPRLQDHFYNWPNISCTNHISNGRLSHTVNKRSIYDFSQSLCISTAIPRFRRFEKFSNHSKHSAGAKSRAQSMVPTKPIIAKSSTASRGDTQE